MTAEEVYAILKKQIQSGGGGSDSGSSNDSAPSIVETYNGQTIQCSMSADRPLKGLNLYATCKQNTYSGKNLFNKETIEDGVVNASGQLTSNEAVKTSDFIKVKPSTQYKSSFNVAYVKFYTSEKEPVQTENVDITTNTQSFTTGESTEYIRYSFNFSAQPPETLIITEGTNELTPYEPYTGGIPSPNVDYPQEIQTISDFVVEVKSSMGKGATPQTLDITIPEQGFYGIPVASGGNYTDSSGQQWICDEFDFERGVYVQRIGIETINGGYNLSETLDFPGRFIDNKINFANLYKDANNKAICNIALWAGWGLGGDETAWRFAITRRGYYLTPPAASGIDNATELNAFLNDLGVPLVLVGQLEDPIEYNLTDEQVEQYKKLRSYYGTTYIDNDAVPACNMQAELVLDTKLYIDNKFTTLAGQIIEDSSFIVNGNEEPYPSGGTGSQDKPDDPADDFADDDDMI